MSAPTFIYPPPTTGGTPVGGSGTPGTIPRWATGTTLTDSLLVQDTATGPTVTLGANTSPYSSANRGLFSVNGSSSAMIGLTVGGVAAGYFATATSSIQMIAGGSRTLQLGAANAIGMTFDAFNNVGIGTASPVEKLTVAGGITSTAANAAAGSFNGAVIDYSGGNMRLVPSRSGANAGAIQFFYTTSGGVITQGATLDSSSLNISLQSGYGLKLPATNGTTYNTDPNTLDCYAEKDLTATMTCGTSGTITLSTNTLKFTRIGRVVHIYGRLVIGSVSSPVGRLAINTGVGANEYPLATGSGSAWLLSWLAGFTAVPQLLVVSGSGTVYLDRYVAGSVGTDCAAYAQAGSEVVISITYIV